MKKNVGAYTVTTGNPYVKEVEYLDGFQYTGGELNFFPHAEGYVNVVLGTTGNRIFNYVYNYTDHLGNIRLSYTKDMVDNKLKIMEENHYYPFGLKHQKYTAGTAIGLKAIDESTARPGYMTSTPYNYKYNGKEFQDELGLNMYDMDMRQYDPAIARWVVLDPVIHHSMSPYNAFDNNPVFWADPSGADSVFESGGVSVAGISDMYGNSIMGVAGEDDDSSHRRGETPRNLAKAANKAGKQGRSSKAIRGGGRVGGKVLDQGITSYTEDYELVLQTSKTNQKGTATVYIETDGVGHVYLEVNGTVFSYGRYNGSYSPSSGQFGPYGDGVLLKKEGQNAIDFIKERTTQYPTNSYKIEVNTSKTYSYFNSLYKAGSPIVSKNGNYNGRVIDTYTLMGPGGNNCATIVYKGLNAGGANVGAFQSPSSLNLFLFNSKAMESGYNPGLWGPKR